MKLLMRVDIKNPFLFQLDKDGGLTFKKRKNHPKPIKITSRLILSLLQIDIIHQM